jgi:hypothetical protein
MGDFYQPTHGLDILSGELVTRTITGYDHPFAITAVNDRHARLSAGAGGQVNASPCVRTRLARQSGSPETD